jgi:serine protease Do
MAANAAPAAQDFPSYADLANRVKDPVVNIFTTKVIDMGQGTPFGRPNSPFEWGLSLQPLTPQLAQRLGYDKDEQGLVVSQVEALSPAAEAGIQRGDVIKEINRKEVRNLEDLHSIIENLSKKDTLLLVKRGKSTFYAVLEG